MERLILREDLTDTPPTIAGRTLTVRLATYDRVYTIGQKGRQVLRERILPGAFKEPLARPRGALRFRHRGERPGDDDTLGNFYGAMTALREEGGAVIADFEVFAGEAEDKLLRLVQTEAITGVSMSAVVAGSRPARDPRGPITDLTRIRTIDGASLTPSPAYDDAGVLAIREMDLEPPDPAEVAHRAAVLRREREWWASAATVGAPGR
jgi:hypothetical protein